MGMNPLTDGAQRVQFKPTVKNIAETVTPSTAADVLKVSAPVSTILNDAVRQMSHISDSYDANGNIITKYMDSSNNVIYQTPSESVVEARELMAKAKAANVNT